MSALDVVAGIIENERGEILIALRPAHKTLAGYWEFPGGKVEATEDPFMALERELQEELHLSVTKKKDLGSFPFSYEWGAIELRVFVVKAMAQPRPTKDVQVFKWVKPIELNNVRLTPADVEPMAVYLESIQDY